MLERQQALAYMEERVKAPHLRSHMRASEAIMRALAARLGEDEELWGLTGLLHDVDLEAVQDDLGRHGLLGASWLRELGLPEVAVQAVEAHNPATQKSRQTPLDHGLAAAESLTGLIAAAALILPSRKLADLKAKSVLKRMKEPRFAAAVDREAIRECQHLGLELADFVTLGVEAMRALADELGL